MTFRSALFASALVLASFSASSSFAETITSFTGVVTASDPTQLGRLSRNGLPQSWAGLEPYPGEVNSAVTYHYTTYTLGASNFVGAPFVDISVVDETDSTETFLSAYAGSYDPANKEANWLGDPGTSGNYFGVDALDFQVLLPNNSDLVLVMNNTLAGGLGLDLPSDITVNAFGTSDYGAPTPEPGTWLTTMTGLVGAAGLMRRRFQPS